MLRSALLVAGLALLLAACSTSRQTSPQRTATEQLLISAAAERAAERLTLDIPENAKVYVDATNFEGVDAKYAIAAVRERLMMLGAQLVDSRVSADHVVEVRAGALSMDEEKTLVGIPQFDVPIPLSPGLTLPEIALFKKETRKGVAQFAAMGYGTKDGKFIDASGPTYGLSHETHWVVFFFISWTTTDVGPEEEEQGDAWEDALPFEFNVFENFESGYE